MDGWMENEEVGTETRCGASAVGGTTGTAIGPMLCYPVSQPSRNLP